MKKQIHLLTAQVGRAYRTSVAMNVLVASLDRELATICARYGLRSEVNWFDYFPTTTNNDFCNEQIITAATQAGLSVQQRPTPFKFGEDFGWFTQAFPGVTTPGVSTPGAMFGLGAGEQTPALHNPDYDFPDELIETGVRVFSGIVERILGE
ncbi:MAG: M20/M25/M40 family metallo-hydrolase [Rudanella sp.]|nr:M20/M25/M40 family metallo-hydrolase [Rudanella sp.]